MKKEEELELNRGVFVEHRLKCQQCAGFAYKTAQLGVLCLHGTQLYKKLLSAEDEIIKYERQKQRTADNRAIRRDRLKQLPEM